MTTHWTDPIWQAETRDWARDRLAEIGRVVVGEITQPHVMPWSTVFRIPTEGGPFWCKASGPGSAYEGRLLDAFARHGITGALLPIATDAEQALMLLPDGGSTLRAARPDGTGDHDLTAWGRILDGYAALQRTTEPIVEELIDVGVPDLRPDRLVDALQRLIEDDGIWARADAEDRDEADTARRRLPELLPAVTDLANVLTSSGIAPTIQHDDLHGGNILVGTEGDRIFDWGDAIVAHPFMTMTATMNSIAHHTGLDQDGAELRGLRGGYIENWTDVAPREVLRVAVRAAMVLGAAGRAVAWDRALEGVEFGEVPQYAGYPAGWLIEFVMRLDRAHVVTKAMR